MFSCMYKFGLLQVYYYYLLILFVPIFKYKNFMN